MKNIITYKEFTGTVNFSADDRIFFGKVEGIDDLITFEDSTVEELESAFRFMVDQHLADCAGPGKGTGGSLKEKRYMNKSYNANTFISVLS